MQSATIQWNTTKQHSQIHNQSPALINKNDHTISRNGSLFLVSTDDLCMKLVEINKTSQVRFYSSSTKADINLNTEMYPSLCNLHTIS